MFPWLWVYAPNYQFPWSGAWAQSIDTDTVVGALTREGSKNAALERKAIDIASYGRQLGWITEVLLGRTSADPKDQIRGEQALAELRRVHDEIETLKERDPAIIESAAVSALLNVLLAAPATYANVLAKAEDARKRLGPSQN